MANNHRPKNHASRLPPAGRFCLSFCDIRRVRKGAILSVSGFLGRLRAVRTLSTLADR